MNEQELDDRSAATAAPESGAPQGEGDRLAAAAAEKAREAEELHQRLLRLQADFDNFRRRSRQEKEELSQVVTFGVIRELLPVLDNFERALAAGSDAEQQQFRTGVEMVHRQLVQIFEKLGITPIVALGAPFDPARHEAVMRVEDDSQPDGLIVGELQKGYEAGGKVLRPSMVKVVSNS